MRELELQQYLLRKYPQENARCEWKEFKNLKNSFCGDEKNDVISYVSAIANMEGGHLVIGVAENGGYPPTQNGDIRSLFWLFSLMALQN